MFEHVGISLSTGNNYIYNPKNNNNTAVLNHTCNNCNATLDHFRVIGGTRKDFLLCLKESLLIKLYKPILNKNVKSMYIIY